MATLREWQNVSSVGATEVVRVVRGPVQIDYLAGGASGATVHLMRSHAADKSDKVKIATYGDMDLVPPDIYDAVDGEGEYLWFETDAITSGSPRGRIGQ